MAIQLQYEDFDLEIRKTADGYETRVRESPGGEAVAPFELPFSELQIENFVLKLGRVRRGTRRVRDSEVEDAREFGGALFKALFRDEVLAALRSSVARVRGESHKGLRLKLRLQDAPALADLPWEFLHDTELNRFLSQSNRTPIVRYLEVAEQVRPYSVTLPLKILAMVSSPSGYDELDVERERRLIEGQLQDLSERRLVEITWLEKATFSELQRELQRGEYHVFHFIGHGGFSRGEGLLVLEDEQGRPWEATASRLAPLLHDHESLRLAVLNSCEGARNSKDDPFSGVASTLVRQGLPAVVAMQFEITDAAALTFARVFYQSLSAGLPVDASVAESRKAIYAQPNDLEWGTPVLYMRTRSGKLFDVDAARATKTTAAAQAPRPPARTPASHEPKEDGPKSRLSKRALIFGALVLLGGVASLVSSLLGKGEESDGPSAPPPAWKAFLGDWAQPMSGSGFDDRTGYPKRIRRSADGAVMALIRAGEITHVRFDWEDKPIRRKLIVAKPFYLDTTEVTNAQWMAYESSGGPSLPPLNRDAWGAATPSGTNMSLLDDWIESAKHTAPGLGSRQQFPSHPVVLVSARQARAYARWLGTSLPSAAQFELARWGGGSPSVAPWRDDAPPLVPGNYLDHSFTEFAGLSMSEHRNFAGREYYRDEFPLTAPVGSFAANAFGVADTWGNVSEICENPAGGVVIVDINWSIHYLSSLSSITERIMNERSVTTQIGFRCAKTLE